MAPMDATGWSSKMAFQVTPPLVVLKMPPTAPATYIVLMSPGRPTNAGTRPACAVGPMLRQARVLSASETAAVGAPAPWADRAGRWTDATPAARQAASRMGFRARAGRVLVIAALRLSAPPLCRPE